jgi:hypothetical protein
MLVLNRRLFQRTKKLNFLLLEKVFSHDTEYTPAGHVYFSRHVDILNYLTLFSIFEKIFLYECVACSGYKNLAVPCTGR